MRENAPVEIFSLRGTLAQFFPHFTLLHFYKMGTSRDFTLPIHWRHLHLVFAKIEFIILRLPLPQILTYFTRRTPLLYTRNTYLRRKRIYASWLNTKDTQKHDESTCTSRYISNNKRHINCILNTNYTPAIPYSLELRHRNINLLLW